MEPKEALLTGGSCAVSPRARFGGLGSWLWAVCGQSHGQPQVLSQEMAARGSFMQNRQPDKPEPDRAALVAGGFDTFSKPATHGLVLYGFLLAA